MQPLLDDELVVDVALDDDLPRVGYLIRADDEDTAIVEHSNVARWVRMIADSR